jgi:hypothetical protein
MMELGDVKGAHANLQKAAALCPADSRTHFLAGAAAQRLGDPVGAKRHYEACLAVDPVKPGPAHRWAEGWRPAAPQLGKRLAIWAVRPLGVQAERECALGVQDSEERLPGGAGGRGRGREKKRRGSRQKHGRKSAG